MNKILTIVIIILSIIYIISSPSKNETVFLNDENVINVALKDVESDTIRNLDLEEYVIGVIAGEMPASFLDEALKAQAIASRTYAIYKMNTTKETYDLVSDITNQVYLNKSEMEQKWQDDYDFYYQKIAKAVSDTKNLVMKYNDEVISSYYFSMSNGKTEDVSLVFGETCDYLKSVDSSWDKNIKNYEVTVSFTKEDFLNKLGLLSNEVFIGVTKRSDTGRINTITINNTEFLGTKVRSLLSLRSTDFTIDIDGDNINITTKGYGHGVGMSQYGANEMAKIGYNYEEILKHYYQGVTIDTI